MKILHVHPSSSMSKRFVYPLMEKEKQIGFKTILINFKSEGRRSKIPNFDLSIKNINLLYHSMKFLLYVRKINPDIIFCHNSVQSFIPIILLSFIRKKKIIYFNHGVTYLGYSGMMKFFLFLIEKTNLVLAHKTLTVSKEMKFYLDKIGSNVSIIKNGSACGIKIDGLKNKKNNYPFKNKKLIITYVGRLEVRKGAKVLLKILDFFEKSNNISFIFCGFNEDSFFKFSGKKFKNLKCLGFINNVDKILESSDILILPSYHEGLPYSILEGMVNGALIIGNDIPGIRSLIKDGYNGYLIRNNDYNLYISLILKILKNEINSFNLINNSFEMVKKYERNHFLIEYGKFLKRAQFEI